jgi:hypothetical protein
MSKYSQRMSAFPEGRYPRIVSPKSITQAKILAVEDYVGYKLPADYLEFVSEYGGFAPGGYTIFPIEPYNDGIDEAIVSVFFGIGHGDGYDLLEECKTRKEIWGIPSKFLPIAQDPGGSIVFLALDGPENGKVYFWDINDPPEVELHFVADTFDQFIESLKPMKN